MSVNYIDKSTGDLIRVAGGGNDILYAEAPIGSIIPFGGTTAPNGFLLCQGQAVSRTTYAELFAVIGTSFGSGDGSTTFNVPDLRETVPVGSGTRGSGVASHDAYNVGEFKDDQLQEHAHEYLPSLGTSRQNKAKGRTYNGDSGANIGVPYVADSSQDTYIIGKVTTHYEGYENPRTGTTTHGKQLGVTYVIKATQVGVPADFAPVDVVENGNMKAVTSNAVAGLFAFENISFSISVAAQGRGYIYINIPSKAGYTAKLTSLKDLVAPVDLAGIMVYTCLNQSTGKCLVVIHNDITSAQTIAGLVTVMYVKE